MLYVIKCKHTNTWLSVYISKLTHHSTKQTKTLQKLKKKTLSNMLRVFLVDFIIDVNCCYLHEEKKPNF